MWRLGYRVEQYRREGARKREASHRVIISVSGEPSIIKEVVYAREARKAIEEGKRIPNAWYIVWEWNKIVMEEWWYSKRDKQWRLIYTRAEKKKEELEENRKRKRRERLSR